MRAVVYPVLRHRLQLSYDAVDGVSADQVLQRLLDSRDTRLMHAQRQEADGLVYVSLAQLMTLEFKARAEFCRPPTPGHWATMLHACAAAA